MFSRSSAKSADEVMYSHVGADGSAKSRLIKSAEKSEGPDIERTYEEAIGKIQRTIDEVNSEIRERSAKVRAWTREHPYQSLAMVVAAASLFGLVLGRSTKR